MTLDDAAAQYKAYEALRTVLWKTDAIRLGHLDQELHDALTTLCEYLTQ